MYGSRKSAPMVLYPSFIVRGGRRLCSFDSHLVFISLICSSGSPNCWAMSLVGMKFSSPSRIRSKSSYLMPSSFSARWPGHSRGVEGFVMICFGIPMCEASCLTCVLYRSMRGEMSAATSPYFVK